MLEDNNSCSIDSNCCSTSNEQSKTNLKEHWEKSYEKDETKLGWYQDSARESLELIIKTGISENEKIIDIGSGSSVLIDDLIDEGYSNIIATDISQKAMEKTKTRLSKNDLNKVTWVVDDLTQPMELKNLNDISVWHDRAVFHFLTEEKDRETYFELLNNAVKKDGYVIIATFNLTGATKCSGLPVQRYDEKGIAKFLGKNFNLVDFFDFDYTMPSGEVRPYVYTLFRKKSD